MNNFPSKHKEGVKLFLQTPLVLVFTCIYPSHIGSRFDYPTSGHGWVLESKSSAIGIEDGPQEIHKGKTPPRSC